MSPETSNPEKYNIKNPLVSVVVTTKNEEKNIENCLISIKEQTYNNIQTIVVDNFSTDRTKEIAQYYTDLIFDKGPERSSQRNFGMIEIATGYYVMFVDADMILSPRLVETCVNYLEAGEFLALHIPEIVLGKKYWSRVRRFERRFYDGTVVDGARFFLKDTFTKIGGFDTTMSGPEDWDIDKKIKQFGRIGLIDCKSENPDPGWRLEAFIKKCGVNPSAFGNVIYHNESEIQITKYLAKKEYYSKSFEAYISKWGSSDDTIKKQFGVRYRLLVVFIENGKWRKLLSNPQLSIGMYLLRLLVGFNFLTGKR